MDLRQLEQFVAVAEERQFTRAAKRMNLVQSGLSASIRALEAELNAELFVRSTRKVEMTAAGRLLYDKAQIILGAVKEARDAVNALQGLQLGTLAIGTVQCLGAFIDLTAVYERFHANHPNIEISHRQDSSTHLLEKIKDGEIDLAFLPVCEPIEGVITQTIARDVMVLICKDNYSLAGERNIDIKNLKNESFIDFQADWGTRRIVDRIFSQSRIRRRIAFEVGDLQTLLDLVARGLGVALVPEAIAKARSKASREHQTAIGRLRRPETVWELVVAYADHRNFRSTLKNPAARAFLDLIDQLNLVPKKNRKHLNKA